MLTRAEAEKYLDKLLTVLHVVDELVKDKLMPAEIALAGVKAALASIDSDKVEHATPEEIRDIAVRLRADLDTLDETKDKKLHDKFDPGGS
jgi:hypothetical protein